MEEKILNDINNSTGMSFFYPCSGMDIESVINILNYKDDFLMARTFFLVDLNIDHDDDVPGWNQRQLYFDNKLGINNLKITKKEEYSLEDIEDFVKDFLPKYIKKVRFNQLVSKIVEPKAFRYELEYNSEIIVLYLFHYEACIISEKLKSIKNNSRFGLILQSHVNGGYKDDFFINKMKEFDADFLKIDTFDIKNFTNYYSLNDNNLFTKHNLSESQLKNLLLYCKIKKLI